MGYAVEGISRIGKRESIELVLMSLLGRERVCLIQGSMAQKEK